MNTATPTKGFWDVVAKKVQEEDTEVWTPAKRYLDGVTSLPPAPKLVCELLTLFRDPDHDVHQVLQLISYEPALTAQVLRICNSVEVSGERPPSDMFEAVSRVGFYQIYCLVVSIFGAKTKAMEGASKGVNVNALWRHSLVVAVAASVVAEQTGQTKAVAFTSGLLHDIGKLVLASSERESYALLIQRAKDEGVALTTLERSAFVVDHAALGGELMQRWNLPTDVAAAVRYHHNLKAAPPYEQLTAAVQLGDMIAHKLFPEDGVNPGLVTLSTTAWDTLRLSPQDFPKFVALTQEEMKTVNDLFEI